MISEDAIVMGITLRLREILQEQGISQRELAKRIHVRPNTINHLCSDQVNAIYLHNIESICKTLSIGVSDLIKVE